VVAFRAEALGQQFRQRWPSDEMQDVSRWSFHRLVAEGGRDGRDDNAAGERMEASNQPF
jgi:hypothetical protein